MTDKDLERAVKFMMLPKEERDRIINTIAELGKMVFDLLNKALDDTIEKHKEEKE